jgi:soluble lytic murein transglycosylase-like protein
VAPAPTSTDAPATTPTPPTAPALANPDEVAAALRYLAATQPAPEPAPAPAPVAAPTGGGSVEDAIATYFGDVYDKAIRVARCESGLNPAAVSAGGGNWGLFQINKVHQGLVESMGYSWDQILDPYVNAAVARHIYDGSGWSPWGCRYA